ncbi:MAG TPA: dihydrofolate reductase family protein [Pseudonocardiaceae bacterium]|jgi:dihydrofolate reductase|nr:dihydrofolate reductase family protein [Pseudonocardiaceae bacterium]
MRKLTYYVASSVDGFIAGPGGSIDFFPFTNDVKKYIVAEFPETLPTHVRISLGVERENRYFDTVIMGRVTYDPALAEGITSPYAHLEQYVATRSLTSSPDPAVSITSDPIATVRELKQAQGAGIWLAGGAKLAGALLPEIDELIVKIYPVAVGSGIPLFDTHFTPTLLQLTANTLLDSGTAILSYTK